ncbi:hypothetical protein OIY81_2488 [Cryptosporidium canis]|nr:hypothetical protein OIY81_2488 [Cryptosporidium canis]
MIHDILLSLTGLVGDKIVVDPEEFVSSSISLYSYRYSLRLKSSVRECLSETESSLVDRILGVSSNFYSVNEFVRRVQGSVYNRHANYNSNSTFGFETGVGRGRDLQIRADLNRRLLRINPVGLYIHAVARCMQEYIVRFLQKISQLEREVFENPNLPLTFVLASITKPARVLEHFMAFIDEWYTLAINSRVDSTCRFSFSNMFITMERFENVCEIYISVPCGYILDYFYSGISSGDLLQESVSRNFLLVCCRVFCYQMVNWIALGKLVDPFEEFIVGRFSISASAHPSGAKSGPASSEPFSLPSNDSCVEALDMEENTCRLYSREEAIHCGVFEWEGLFYTRFESFTKKLFALKFQYKVFGVGKIVSFVRTGLLERLSDLCPSQLQVRLLSRYGDESVRARVSGAGLQGHLEQVSSILNESFPHIQPQLEGLLEKFRREISSLMYSSILADGLPAPGEACTSLQAPENTLQQSIQLVRDLYFLGNSDLFLQLDHSIFHKSMGSDEPPTRNSNIGEQLEFVSAAWRDALTSARLSGAWASTHGISESRVSICCDTFDLFSFGLSETELVESFNCQISDTTLHLGGKPGLHADPKLESGQDRPEGAGSLGVVQEGVDVASMCRIRWPIRIIDGFNHVLECVSSLDVVSSLLFTASGGLPLRGGRLVGLGEGDPESTGEFLRLTWGFGFKDRTRQVLEFSIRLYWHTKNLKSLLNTEDDFSLLKTNVLEVPNPQVGLYAYRTLTLTFVFRCRRPPATSTCCDMASLGWPWGRERGSLEWLSGAI